MSMMGTEHVGLDFSVSGNYGASLTQMIQQADQYARSADTMIGKIASLNVVTTALLTRTTALTGANRVATAEAAAYQQRLAGISASAVAAERDQDRLAKQTLALARQFGSMDQAVAIMGTLQRSGLATSTSMEKMGKTVAELDAANGSFGGALGQQLLMLNRQFGNSETALSKYGDTLTSVTAKYGASVQGTLGFAQALAPVASSVGVSETAVLGLGAAAARLGQDGYAGANAFNKVLLDMSRSIRSGTPDLKNYADAMGMTQSALAELMKQDPTEVLVRFTEAIGKGGPDAMRTLETLGFDAVRTTKAITALSAQGNLRQIISDSSKAYGSGSTAKAAETALDTVNHKAEQLQETLSQTVAGAGRPFLTFLSDVETVANKAAEAVNSIVNNDWVQRLGAAGAVGSFVGSAASSAVGGMSLAALGATGFRWGRNRYRDFGAGRDMVRGGAGALMAPDAPFMVRAGGQFAGMVGEPMWQRGALRPSNWLSAAGIGRGAANWGSWALNAQTNMLLPLTTGEHFSSSLLGRGLAGIGVGRDNVTTVMGQRLRQTMGDLWRGSQGGAWGSGDLGAYGRALEGSGKALVAYTKTVTEATNASGRLVTSFARLGAQTVAGGAALGGAGLRGLGALGISPALLGVGAAVGVGMYAYSKQEESSQLIEESKRGFQDAWAQYNDFAAAVGQAGKGLVALTPQITDVAKELTKNVTGSGLMLTPEQQRLAGSGGYTAGFKTGGVDEQTATVLARLLLGANASAQDTNRVVMDYASQSGGNYQGFASGLGGLQAKGADVYGTAFKSYESNRSIMPWVSETDVQARVEEGIKAEATRTVTAAQARYGTGSQAAQAAALVEAQKVVTGAQGAGPVGADQAAAPAARTLQGLLGLSDDQAGQVQRGIVNGTDLTQILKDVGATQSSDALEQMTKRGFRLDNPNFALLDQNSNQAVDNAKQTDQAFNQLAGTASTLNHSLNSAAEAADKYANGDLTKVTSAQAYAKGGVVGIAMNDVLQNNTPQTQGRLADTVLAQARKDAGGDQQKAAALLVQALGSAQTGSTQYDAIAAALAQNSATGAVQQAGLGMMQNTQQAIGAGRLARGMGYQSDPTAEAARQQLIQGEQQALAQREGFMKQYLQAAQQTEWALTRQQEQAQVARVRSERDYERQRSYAQADFAKQRMRAQRDFDTSMARAAEDAAKSIYSPYERMSAQQVWDARSLITNMADQNAAIAKQTAQVAALRKKGLSQQAIDQLDLTNAAQRSQVDRLTSDAGEDSSIIARINATARRRGTVATAATQNENNVDFRRQQQDFRRSMRDSSVDFATAMGRSAVAHRTALADMNADLATARRNAMQDLSRMGSEVSGSFTEIEKKFLGKVAELPSEMKPAMSTNLKLMVGAAAEDAGTAMDTALAPYGLTATTFRQLISAAIASNSGTPQGEHSGGRIDGRGGSTQMGSLPNSASGALRTAASISAGPPMKPGLCDHFVGEAYGLAHSGYPSARDHWKSTPGKYRYPGMANAPAGALVFWDVGKDGHVALSAGGGMVWSTDFKRQGHVDLVPINEISRRWGPLYGWSQPYFGGRTTPLERGGVVTGRLQAELGEAGREVVLPLNQHGARAMAEAMVRYLDSGTAQATRVAPYATPTANYVYDQRVMITGPVKVEAQDPNQMGRKLESKRRLDALRQPVGGR